MKRKLDSKITVRYMGAPIAEVAKHTHEEMVSYCDYCGNPLSRSDVNDYGTLCERCYMKEYYNEND